MLVCQPDDALSRIITVISRSISLQVMLTDSIMSGDGQVLVTLMLHMLS